MKNLFKFLLLGAFTFSLGVGFVGCKNYDKDIEEICQRLDDMDALIKGFTDNGGKFVTDVTSATGGITVKYSDGSSAVVTIGGNIQDAYVVKNENGSWTLYAQEKGKTDYVAIPLLGAASALAKIEVWGWTDDALQAADATPGVLSIADEIQNLASDDFNVRYARIANFVRDNDGAGATDGDATGGANRNPNSWEGGKHKLERGVITNTLTAEGTGLIIEVFPATADATGMTFELRNTDGDKLPIAFQKPVAITDQVVNATRAANGSALYFVQGDYTNETWPNNANAYVAAYDGATAGKGPVYALYLDGVKVSEYTNFTVVPTEVETSKEAAVEDVENAGVPVGGTVTVGGVAAYQVNQGVAYGVTFDVTAPEATTANDAVVDYYLEIADKSELDEKEFAVTISADKTTFTITRLPDVLTLATFDLNVYKLSVTGVVYMETIKIRPLRNTKPFTIDLGEYIINDKDTFGEDGSTNTTNYMSKDITVDLNPMFDDLAKVTMGASTMKNLWQNATSGAKAYQITKFTIDGEDMDLAAGEDGELLMTAWDRGIKTVAGTTTGGTTSGTAGEGGSYTFRNANNQAVYPFGAPITANALYNAKNLLIKVPYAVDEGNLDDGTATDTVAAAFPELDVEYAITFTFVDGDGGAINDLTITFTPTIPALADMFKKDASFWNADQTILMAYYRDPASWASGNFYANTTQGTNYPATPGTLNNTASTFYNILRPANTAHTPGAPADGGFTKFGTGGATDTEWIAGAGLTLPNSGTEKIGGKNASTLVGTTFAVAATPARPVVELYNQYTKNPGVGDAYNQPVTMRVLANGYLNVYDYAPADINALDFKIQIMSALERGSIASVSGGAISIPAADANTTGAKIAAKDISGYTYNGKNGPYSLFQVYVDKNGNGLLNDSGEGPIYAYTYIDSVEFSAANDAAFDVVTGPGDYTIATAAVDPKLAADNKSFEESYVFIKSSNITTTTTGKLNVKVTDRFGQVKTGTVDVTITVQ